MNPENRNQESWLPHPCPTHLICALHSCCHGDNFNATHSFPGHHWNGPAKAVHKPSRKNILPCSCFHGELQQGWGRGEQLSRLSPHKSPFLISSSHIFYLPTASCTCPDPSHKPQQKLISPSPHHTCKASTPLFIMVCMNRSLSIIPHLALAPRELLCASHLPCSSTSSWLLRWEKPLEHRIFWLK